MIGSPSRLNDSRLSIKQIRISLRLFICHDSAKELLSLGQYGLLIDFDVDTGLSEEIRALNTILIGVNKVELQGPLVFV
jgi:hypothetical protein